MKAILRFLPQLFIAAALPVFGAALSVDEALQQLKTYREGQPNAALVTLEQSVGRASGDSASRAQMAVRLSALLADPSTTPDARLFLCQQLRLVAGDAQVPLLAKLLADPQTADMARLVLQVLPGEAAAKTLTDALGGAKGLALTGIINSLGDRREAGAANPLAGLLSDPDPTVAGAAALALGKIGSPDAATALEAAQPPTALSATFREARLTCAQRLVQAGEKKVAEGLCLRLLSGNPPANVRMAALSGLANAAGDAALPQLTAAMQSGEPPVAAFALELARRLNSPEATAAIKETLPKMEGPVQMAAMGALAARGDAAALQELTQRASSTNTVVRATATRELRRLRYAAGPEVLTRLEEAGEAEAETAALSPAPYAPQVIDQRRKELAKGIAAGDKLLAYLDCGVETSVRDASGVGIRQLNGQAYQYPGSEQTAPAPSGTVAYNGSELDFEVSGLDPAKYYAIGFTWWDYDNNGRVQSVVLSGGQPKQTETVQKEVKLPNYLSAKQGPATVQILVKPKLTAGGKTRLAFRHSVGPNVVVSELWVLETTADAKPIVASPAPRKNARVLIVTGIDYPGHPWKETAPALKAILEKDPRLTVRVVEDQNFLDSSALTNYDAVILHFMDWEIPGPGPAARENLRQFVTNGGGLMLTHFTCGAWDNNEWPEFKKLAGRVWDPKLRGHDPHGKFTVEIADPEHPITKGMQPFETLDELYTCLAGDTPIHVIAKATSKVDKKEYPMAFVLSYGKGRVFHSPLGHDARAYAAPGVGELMRRGCAWAAGL